MTSYSEQEFYGGAIVGAIPTGWIDTSVLREVPDHQEIFLSPKTLSNLIFELNQRVDTTEAMVLLEKQQQTTTAPRGGTPATHETIDKAVLNYHLHDLCDEGDTVQMTVPPQSVHLPQFTTPDHPYSAYKGVATFTTPKTQRKPAETGFGAGGRIPAPVDGSAASTTTTTTTATTTTTTSTRGVGGTQEPQVSRFTCHYLMVRLERQETDILALFNVPHDEFDAQGDAAGLSREEEFASGLVDTMVEKLKVKDWDLFS